ncbi:MAG: hypothetical protein M1365_17125 [Actinobacteria bacterium]|nr:hypothetical protein [Actinomycetota bacterium]
MAGLCYLGTIDPLNKLHTDIVIDIFSKAQHRIFVDAYDISQKPSGETWPDFVNRIWKNCSDGMRFWKNDEGEDHHLLGVLGEGSIYNQLLACKDTGAIPIICIGHSEEKSSWLSPGSNLLNHLTFLELFSKYTAIWLREKMGFIQAHLEIWNEPQKFMIVSTYAKVAMAMARGFLQYPNFKVHFGSNDINIDVNSYLPMLLQKDMQGNYLYKDLLTLMKGQYYSTHELWPWQHGRGYISEMVKLLEGTGIKLSVTECSPTGDWGQYGLNNDYGKLFNDLRDYHIEIYCILFIIRRDFFGDVFDEIKVFTREGRPDIKTIDYPYGIPPGGWLPNGYSMLKHSTLRTYNQKYYNEQLPLEDEGMDLKDIYKKGMRGEIGIYFIQMVLNEDIKPYPLLKVDGWWGDKTNPIVLQYQKKYGLNTYSGEVGPNTFQHMIRTYPNIWDKLHYLKYTKKIILT